MVRLNVGNADDDSPAHASMTLLECERQTQRLVNEMNAVELELFNSLNDIFYKSTAIIRETGETEPDKTAHSRLLMASSAPVLLAMEPFLRESLRGSQNQIMLGLLAYPTRFRHLKFNRDIARGYMVERIIYEGNVWERPHDELIWLGANAMSFAHICGELQARKTVAREIIEEMMKSEPALSSGSL